MVSLKEQNNLQVIWQIWLGVYCHILKRIAINFTGDKVLLSSMVFDNLRCNGYADQNFFSRLQCLPLMIPSLMVIK